MFSTPASGLRTLVTVCRAVLLTAGLLLTACSSSGGEGASGPIPADAETALLTSPEAIAVGSQRMVFQLKQGPAKFGGPNQQASVLLDALGIEPVEIPATWVWGDQDAGTGAYVVEADLGRAGTWLATLTVDGTPGTQTAITVYDNSPIPRTGDVAPATATDTLADFDLAALTTDPNPDERFYARSISDAIATGTPAVVVFSTPKYCTTDVCGPVLDLVKSRMDDHDGIAFVHVEVYEELEPDQTQLIPRQAILEWGIQSEPWIFTIDAAGLIVRSFEGVLGDTELDTALAEITVS